MTSSSPVPRALGGRIGADEVLRAGLSPGADLDVVHSAVPSLRVGSRLEYAFDEDELSLAWDATRRAGLPRGARIAATMELPEWWWKGTGFVPDPAGIRLVLAQTSVGPVCVVGRGHPEEAARQAWAATPVAPAALVHATRAARDGPDTAADFPLGATVAKGRHDEVLAGRMRLGAGRVVTWTTIRSGAAPTEFVRLQAAMGAYHVALVEHALGRTVGIWAHPEPPQQGQETVPVLRRLLRQEGMWRHGVKFAPAP